MATPNAVHYAFKKDKYSKARGGNSHFLCLSCSNCNQFIALYQKDGIGRLLRLYLDRIFEPSELAILQEKVSRRVDMPDLKCPRCQTLLGTPMVYPSEGRLAFRLIRGRLAAKSKNSAQKSQHHHEGTENIT
ncbi:MAG: hypothetical protein WBI29_00585 [Candidatus Saccharimonadales bacterium]